MKPTTRTAWRKLQSGKRGGGRCPAGPQDDRHGGRPLSVKTGPRFTPAGTNSLTSKEASVLGSTLPYREEANGPVVEDNAHSCRRSSRVGTDGKVTAWFQGAQESDKLFHS